jgi:hypothetical protein
VQVFTGQKHEVIFQSSSPLNDAVSFDFTGDVPQLIRLRCPTSRLRRPPLELQHRASAAPLCHGVGRVAHVARLQL